METVNRRRAAVKAAFPATVPVMTGFLAWASPTAF